MAKSRISLFLLAAVLAVSFFAGCAPARKPVPDSVPRQKVTEPKNNINGKDSMTDDMESKESVRIAKQLASEAAKVKGVKSAAVVYNNRTALVGLDLQANIEANRTEEIKQEVSARLKKNNKNVDTVSISTDADTITRIKKIAKGIQQGRPVSEFAKELSEITRRITPSVK